MGVPQVRWMVYLTWQIPLFEMDDDWGYPCFGKPPSLVFATSMNARSFCWGNRSFSGSDHIQFQAIVSPIPIHFAKAKLELPILSQWSQKKQTLWMERPFKKTHRIYVAICAAFMQFQQVPASNFHENLWINGLIWGNHFYTFEIVRPILGLFSTIKTSH